MVSHIEAQQIRKIRDLAGKIGECHIALPPSSPDAEAYETQVQVGLARSVTQILDCDASRLAEWFGHCLIACGMEIDRSTETLLDALEAKLASCPRRSAEPVER